MWNPLQSLFLSWRMSSSHGDCCCCRRRQHNRCHLHFLGDMVQPKVLLLLLGILLLLRLKECHAFLWTAPATGGGGRRISTTNPCLITPTRQEQQQKQQSSSRRRQQHYLLLHMASMDPITYLRTEWISAALCTNQIPRTADACLQLGTQDGRAITFVPRTIRTFITSSLENNGQLTIQTQRQLKQSQERRQGFGAQIEYCNQRADDLTKTASASMDAVISLQAVDAMIENGLDWKRSIQEAARVLKPGGRFLWVEPTTVQGESYIDYVENLVLSEDDEDVNNNDDKEEEGNSQQLWLPIFDDVGYDEIPLTLQPYIAGVAIKRLSQATLQQMQEEEQRQEEDKRAEISLQVLERGLKKKKKKKKRKTPKTNKATDEEK